MFVLCMNAFEQWLIQSRMYAKIKVDRFFSGLFQRSKYITTATKSSYTHTLSVVCSCDCNTHIPVLFLHLKVSYQFDPVTSWVLIIHAYIQYLHNEKRKNKDARFTTHSKNHTQPHNDNEIAIFASI